MKELFFSDDTKNWKRLSVNNYDFSLDAETIEDTVFGQRYGSTTKGLVSWGSNLNIIMKGNVGYTTTLKRNKSRSNFSENLTRVDSTTYASSNLVYIFSTVTIDGVLLDESEYVAKPLASKIIFNNPLPESATVTVTGEDYDFETIGSITSFTLSQETNLIDKTRLGRSGLVKYFREYSQGLKTVSFSCTMIDTEEDWDTIIQDREPFVIEIDFGSMKARGIFKLRSFSRGANVGSVEETNLEFTLYAPDMNDNFFTWFYTDNSNINTLMSVWESNKDSYIRYVDKEILEGKAIPSSINISGSLSSMVELDVVFRGTGEYYKLASGYSDEVEDMSYTFKNLDDTVAGYYQASNNEYIGADTSEGSWTINLPPNPVLNTQAGCFDVSMSWADNPLTVDGNGKLIHGQSSIELDVNGGNMTFVFDGTEYKVSRRA